MAFLLNKLLLYQHLVELQPHLEEQQNLPVHLDLEVKSKKIQSSKRLQQHLNLVLGVFHHSQAYLQIRKQIIINNSQEDYLALQT